jgi:hypothetical protein
MSSDGTNAMLLLHRSPLFVLGHAAQLNVGFVVFHHMVCACWQAAKQYFITAVSRKTNSYKNYPTMSPNETLMSSN